MSASMFDVRPRYTPGSPAMVDRATAERVARDERAAYHDAISWSLDPQHAKAREQGLGGIVRECWEHHGVLNYRDLLTGHRGIIESSTGATPRS